MWQFGRQPAPSVFEIELDGLRQAAVWGTSPPLRQLRFLQSGYRVFLLSDSRAQEAAEASLAARVLLDVICRHEEWKRTGLVGLLPADANGVIVTED